MSELDAIDTYGDGLFGHGTQAALEALGKTYELAFMKALSQLSSPSEGIVDQTGQIGVAREIANYKTSMAIVETLAFAVVTETNPNVKAVLKQLSSEFSDFATQAADRIINASAFHDANTTVERALAEIFQASDAYVQDLLAPTPGADWSVEEITGAVKDALAAGNSASSVIKLLQQTGVDAASQSMTTLSLNLEAYAKQAGPTAGAPSQPRLVVPRSCSMRCSIPAMCRRCKSTKRSPSISTPVSPTGCRRC